MDTRLCRIRNPSNDDEHHRQDNGRKRGERELGTRRLRDDKHDRAYEKEYAYAITVIVLYFVALRNDLTEFAAAVIVEGHNS